MNFMKSIAALSVLAVSALAATTANAVQITGGISLAGFYTVDTGDVNTANAFTSFGTVTVESTTLAFNGTNNSLTMTPYSFDPFPALGVTPAWVTVVGPADPGYARFDFLTLTQLQQCPMVGCINNSLTIVGTGMLYRFGYDPTPGTYLFTANQAAGTFSFSASNAATPVPEPGSLALLGLGLVGLGLARRRVN